MKVNWGEMIFPINSVKKETRRVILRSVYFDLQICLSLASAFCEVCRPVKFNSHESYTKLCSMQDVGAEKLISQFQHIRTSLGVNSFFRAPPCRSGDARTCLTRILSTVRLIVRFMSKREKKSNREIEPLWHAPVDIMSHIFTETLSKFSTRSFWSRQWLHSIAF